MQHHGKSPATIVHGRDPLNVETPPPSLMESFVTPTSLFFVRSHGSLPEVDLQDYSLEVSGLVDRPLRLTLDELRDLLPKRELTASLHCAGNRRAELMRHHPIPDETPWGAGAVGNARWAGVSLRELLLEAGVAGGARHVAFTGLDVADTDFGPTLFGGSIPLEQALDPDVLLAHEMNGEPLSAAHGFPLRAVVPGYIGARSVKWLSGIELRSEPSDNYYQTHEYRLYPRDAEPGEPGPSRGAPLGELAVNSAICRPLEGELVDSGPLPVVGYAMTGAGRTVESVEVSVDGGETWTGASLRRDGDGSRAWRLWEAEPDPGPTRERVDILVRARDSSGQTQPATLGQTWNPKGYMNNARHRVSVRRGD